MLYSTRYYSNFDKIYRRKKYSFDLLINEFNKKKYVNVILIIENIFKKNINYSKNIYYYYNISCIKLNIKNKIEISANSISLSNAKKTIVLLDYMDIDYL